MIRLAPIQTRNFIYLVIKGGIFSAFPKIMEKLLNIYLKTIKYDINRIFYKINRIGWLYPDPFLDEMIYHRFQIKNVYNTIGLWMIQL